MNYGGLIALNSIEQSVLLCLKNTQLSLLYIY